MKFAKRSYKLPKWVEINPDDQTVLLRLDQFRMQNGLFVRAEKINLVDDDIRMNIYLPKRNKKRSVRDGRKSNFCRRLFLVYGAAF